MSKDLTVSAADRQNILNNPYAVKQIEEHFPIMGLRWGNEVVFTKQQVSQLFEISDATIERYLSQHGEELKFNGYSILRGADLRKFKELASGTLIDEGTKTTVLGIFSFRAVLNLGMLLTESEQAKVLRKSILDIVIDVIAEKTGGKTKFINQRDEDFLFSAIQEENYRTQFTQALSDYVDGTSWKYAHFTNKIYKSIFRENATEYKRVLKLASNDNVRDTMYSEVLTVIASFEAGLAHEINLAYQRHGTRQKWKEVDDLLIALASHPQQQPALLQARTKMASRDLGFRDALHEKLESYVQAVPKADFERFLGEKSRSLEERLSDPETMAVFKRLKDR